jgi:hypothetical protein
MNRKRSSRYYPLDFENPHPPSGLCENHAFRVNLTQVKRCGENKTAFGGGLTVLA